MSHFKVAEGVADRVSKRIKKSALKVYTWDENSDGVSEFEVPDELAGNMEAISHHIDQQVEGEEYTIEPGEERSDITEVLTHGSDQVAIGFYGRLQMFMVTGPTAQETAQHLFDSIHEHDEMDPFDAIRSVVKG